MHIGSHTCGDVGTLSLGELLEEIVSVGRPNLLFKKGKHVLGRYGLIEKAAQNFLRPRKNKAKQSRKRMQAKLEICRFKKKKRNSFKNTQKIHNNAYLPIHL